MNRLLTVQEIRHKRAHLGLHDKRVTIHQAYQDGRSDQLRWF